MKIRSEQNSDFEQIQNVNIIAFTNHPHSQGNEYQIVNKLRKENSLTVSLVAEDENDRIIGHIAFSPVAIDNEYSSYYGLGPVAVLPENQKVGIGTALINEGIIRIKSLSGKAIVVLGEPEYYSRFGFQRCDGLILKNVPPEYFMVYCFDGAPPKGIVQYHPAFFE